MSGSNDRKNGKRNGVFNDAVVHDEKHYPPQTGRYKVKVKNGSDWRKHRHCRLQVSVGQESHEDDKFKATMGWVSDRFTVDKSSRIYICINDKLQRWNFMFNEGLTEEEATVKANELGSTWMERNGAAYRQVAPMT